jgi:hypothetical protein
MSAQGGHSFGTTQFVPKRPEIVQIRKTTMPLYPKVNATMSDQEKAMAYQQNKTAFAFANLDQCVRILALTKRLDLMLTAESSLANWERKIMKNWANFQNLSIILWHDGHDPETHRQCTTLYPQSLPGAILSGCVPAGPALFLCCPGIRGLARVLSPCGYNRTGNTLQSDMWGIMGLSRLDQRSGPQR